MNIKGESPMCPSYTLHTLQDESEVSTCFPLIKQLRPHLSSSAEWVSRWRAQSAEGYRLLGLRQEDHFVALAGYRLQNNLVYGRFLYVDDLVTDESHRSCGLGERLMAEIKSIGETEGCAKVVLDTPLSNVLGHRFYYRNGLLATALRFNFILEKAS
jgi:ribosomal protein S18 acetylase RimI-like enzyme